MESSHKFVSYLLPLALCLDLIIPFFLAPFFEGYSHLNDVMSVLGNHKFHLSAIYNTWLVALGAIMIVGSIRLFAIVSNVSKPLAILLTVIMAVYAVGGCILSGLFSVGDGKSLETFSAKVHGIGAAIGFMVMIFAALIIAIYYFRLHETKLFIASVICFLLALIFFILFVMADKPSFADTIIAYEGLWQRLSLLFMYTPIAMLCIKSI